MTKKESLDFLQSTLDKIDKATDEEIKRLEKVYDENCYAPMNDQEKPLTMHYSVFLKENLLMPSLLKK